MLYQRKHLNFLFISLFLSLIFSFLLLFFFLFLKKLLCKSLSTCKSRPNIKKNAFVPINNYSLLVSLVSSLFSFISPNLYYFEVNSRHLIISYVNYFSMYNTKMLLKKQKHKTITIPKNVSADSVMSSISSQCSNF